MIAVIIAGGSGTRLWPLSTPEMPKQLLRLTSDRSMIQSTYDRSKSISNDIYVVPDISHADALKAQLPELDDEHFIVEPGRRGTANCIVAALAYIAKRHDNDEPIAIYWSDHHIRDTEGFAQAFKSAGEASSRAKAPCVIGIEPAYPSTGLGYIQRGQTYDDIDGVYEVVSFKEKPDAATAKHFFESGQYFWNCGYMVGSVTTFKEQFSEFSPELMDRFIKLSAIKDIHSPEYTDTYLSFEPAIIDYAYTEKADRLLVARATFDWLDVGSFKDLHDANIKDDDGNYLEGDNIHSVDIENVYIRNEESEKPVAVIGLDNVVVVNTKNGILVARTDLAAKVGDIAKKLQS